MEFCLCTDIIEREPFDTFPLCQSIAAAFVKNGVEPTEARLALLIRKFHGLGAEAQVCAKKVETTLGCKVDVVDPVLLETSFANKTGNGDYDGIIRMSRPVSKHVPIADGRKENESFLKLMEVLKTTRKPPLFPTFNAYLENHSWFYIWETDEFSRFAEQNNFSDLLNEVVAVIPRTGIITEDGRFLNRNGNKTRQLADFRGSVLKRGNSTGAQDLLVLHRPSSGQLRQKEVFPICLDGNTISFVSGYMVYAAYFSAGRYLGGHAVMCPTSRKVHGGFDSYLIPTYQTL